MARALLSPQVADADGMQLSFTNLTVPGSETADDGGKVDLEPGDILVLKNSTGSPVNVVLPATAGVDGLAVPDRTIAVPASNVPVYIGGLTEAAYLQSDGYVYVNPAGAGISAALMRG